MKKLRCWSGALAIITDECETPSLRGRTITCQNIVKPWSEWPEWTYTGERLMAFVDGDLWEVGSIADAVLRPLTPPPGAVKTLTKVDLDLTGDPITIEFEEVTP